jgi:cyclophilin family peptidyl-prolyl cis-trans isomerase
MRIGERLPRPRPSVVPLHVGRVILAVLPFTILVVVTRIRPSSFQTALRQDAAQGARSTWLLSSPQRQQGVGDGSSNNATRTSTTTTTSAILHTPLGNVRILLHPEWAPASTNYVSSLAQTSCEHCFMHAAIRPKGSKETAFAGIIQGRLWSSTNNAVDRPLQPLPKGVCPKNHHRVDETPPDGIFDALTTTTHECFGPIMEKGYVAWAAGRTGPDFFINTFERPVPWWGNVHTVWGQVPLHDRSSWTVLHELYRLPTVRRRRRFFRGGGGDDQSAPVLRDDFHFTVSVEEDGQA